VESNSPGTGLDDLLATDRPPLSPGKRAACWILGWILVLCGVIGWLVPVVTGIPFYIAGFALLGLASRRMARWINALDRRLPYRARVALRRLRRPTQPGP
jgi:hypothetical protein